MRELNLPRSGPLYDYPPVAYPAAVIKITRRPCTAQHDSNTRDVLTDGFSTERASDKATSLIQRSLSVDGHSSDSNHSRKGVIFPRSFGQADTDRSIYTPVLSVRSCPARGTF